MRYLMSPKPALPATTTSATWLVKRTTVWYCATQSYASIEQRLGDKAARAFVNAFPNRIWLGLAEEKDRELASKQCGERWVETKSSSFIERARKSSRWNPVTDRVDSRGAVLDEQRSFKQERRRFFEALHFAELPAFVAIASLFDRGKQQRPTLVYLKPTFRPADETYDQFLNHQGEDSP